jgi:hypothetical protein
MLSKIKTTLFQIQSNEIFLYLSNTGENANKSNEISDFILRKTEQLFKQKNINIRLMNMYEENLLIVNKQKNMNIVQLL